MHVIWRRISRFQVPLVGAVGGATGGRTQPLTLELLGAGTTTPDTLPGGRAMDGGSMDLSMDALGTSLRRGRRGGVQVTDY